MNQHIEHGNHIMDSFEFESGRFLENVNVEYATSGHPKYDDEGNIINALVYFPTIKGGHSILSKFHDILYAECPDEYFLIKITSLGSPDSCSPSSTGLKNNFPEYTIKDRVNFKRGLLKKIFNLNHVHGVIGQGLGGYEVYTWACEYPDEIEFLIVGNSSFKTNSYRYITSKALDNIIVSSDAYLDENYNEKLSQLIFSINSLIYSQIFSKRAFEKFTREELDIYMDHFVEESSNVDIYDFKYRNNAVLDYNLEDKLSNINAKTLIASSSDDIYYTPEFDAYPLKDKIENLEIYTFDAQDFVYNDDYSIFINLFLEFLEEFKK